jgi:hypothetical protein
MIFWSRQIWHHTYDQRLRYSVSPRQMCICWYILILFCLKITLFLVNYNTTVVNLYSCAGNMKLSYRTWLACRGYETVLPNLAGVQGLWNCPTEFDWRAGYIKLSYRTWLACRVYETVLPNLTGVQGIWNCPTKLDWRAVYMKLPPPTSTPPRTY